jgi:iron(III) transport system ATP-binding protein
VAKISISRLTKAFDQQIILNNLSLEIADGSFFTLLGPSGCGKTTLLRCIAGFNEPDAGRILFDADDMTSVPVHQRDIGMVFQDYALFPDKTVFENVAYGLRARKINTAEVERRVREVLDKVDLQALEQRHPAQLSGGQRQRVALARALVIKPRVLLMDEPLSNLDAKLRLSMRQMIRSLQREEKITTVFVTHDQEEALAMSDMIAVMQKGSIAQMGVPEALYAEPLSEYVADFIGSANVFPVQLLRDGVVRWSDQTLSVDTRPIGNQKVPCKLVLRPEAVILSRERFLDGQCVPVKVVQRQYLGAKTSYRVAFMESHFINVDSTYDLSHDLAQLPSFSIGQDLYLHVPPTSRVILA